jgi:hypothetical protein
MKKNTLRTAVVAGFLLFGAAVQAQAAAITWNLQDVTFADGASATGSFTIDAENSIWWAFDIATTDGPSLTAFNYNPTNSRLYFGGYGPNSFTIMQGDGHRYLTFSFLQPLTSGGGTFAINTASSWECYNCSPWRYMSGSVTSEAAAVPEPVTMALMLPTLGMLGWMSRRRKKQAS